MNIFFHYKVKYFYIRNIELKIYKWVKRWSYRSKIEIDFSSRHYRLIISTLKELDIFIKYI